MSQQGLCQENTVYTCIDNQLQIEECAPQGKVCEFEIDYLRFQCVDVTKVNEQCQGISFDGECRDNNVVRCVRGQVIEEKCVNATCATLAGGNRVACVSDQQYTLDLEGNPLIPLCTQEEELRIARAYQGRFIASSCAHSTQPSHILLSLFVWSLLILCGKQVYGRLNSTV